MTTQVVDEAMTRHPFVRGLTRVGRSEPAWLADHRQDATRWLSAHGFPTRHDEDWRYFDLKPILSLPFNPCEETPHECWTAELDSLAGPGLGGPRLVLVNGFFTAGLSVLPSELPPGLRVASLAGEVCTGAPGIQRRWTAPDAGYAHAFEALNAALTADGAYIQLDPDTVFDVPIEIVHLTVARGDLPLVSPRSVISARAGSAATIVETHVSFGEGHSLTNSHTRVVLAPGAHVDHYRFQSEGADAFHLSSVEVHAGAASHFASRTLAVGALLARHEVRARLTYTSADVQLDGLFLPAGQQCHDNPVLVDHSAPGCTSRQLYKGIISGSAHGVFNGHVIVRPAAVGTSTHQINKNLLLSDRAEVDTRPRLEIFTDEVSATHGAAVGQLDQDALFYLRSRGIPDRSARAILVSGFATDVLERFASGPIRDRADKLVAEHLARTAIPPDRKGDRR